MSLPLLNSLRNFFRQALRLPQLYWESRAPVPVTARIPTDGRSVLIISCDPVQVVGSKGDEAMIIALIEKLQAEDAERRISVFCNLHELPASLRAFGIGLERPWSAPWSLRYILSVIRHYDAVVIIGADMLDGYYSLLGAARYWVVANIAARMGKTVVITGFSFNASPPRLLRTFMSPLEDSIHICLRDPVSRERFNRYVGIPERAQLVADMAFSLEPREPVTALSAWSQRKREEARMAIGFNIHPMLFRRATTEEIDKLVRASVRAISAAVELRFGAVALIPHDYRPYPKGDVEVLERIYRALPAPVQRHCFLLEGHLHAAELKALAGHLDLVVTGRMHLAIASLGMGTPVAGITYQDKFQGLFQHFGLPAEFLAPASVLIEEARFEAWLLRAIDAQAALKDKVGRHLVSVKELSRRNFSALLT